MEIQAPDSITQRVRALVAQRQEIDARVQETVLIALEAMGIDGVVTGFDIETGIATVIEANQDPTPLREVIEQ